MSTLNVSERLLDLLDEAVVAGLKPLRLGRELVPFTLTITREGVVMRRFETETVSAGLAQARQAIADAGDTISAYALVYDAVVEIGGDEVDALMLEAAERGAENGLRFVQRYQPRSATQALNIIGKLSYLGTAPLYFAE